MGEQNNESCLRWAYREKRGNTYLITVPGQVVIHYIPHIQRVGLLWNPNLLEKTIEIFCFKPERIIGDITTGKIKPFLVEPDRLQELVEEFMSIGKSQTGTDISRNSLDIMEYVFGLAGVLA